MSESLALRDGARRFKRDFSGPVLLRVPTRVSCLTPTGLSPATVLLSRQLRLQRVTLMRQTLQPRCRRNDTGLGSSPFARHYLGNRYCFLFLRVLRCFSSPGSPPEGYVFTQRMTGLQPAGFSHSDIRGSKLICSSPRLIAAYHVLHRLLMPRHSPYALCNLLP